MKSVDLWDASGGGHLRSEIVLSSVSFFLTVKAAELVRGEQIAEEEELRREEITPRRRRLLIHANLEYKLDLEEKNYAI